MTLAAYFAGPWLAAMMLGLGPVTVAIAAIDTSVGSQETQNCCRGPRLFRTM